ncbi:hypothetical protein JXB02_05620 [Candidatus Woesearchaeota archaeon]|nr:hypothetical protein [Candidatus Woesearchaeota archaeon]
MVAEAIKALRMGLIYLIMLVIFLYGISLGGSMVPGIPTEDPSDGITGSLSRTIAFVMGDAGTAERISPADHITEESVHVYESHIVIDLPGARWATFTDTNSMDPTIDAGANSIEIVPAGPEDVGVGDIISYTDGGSVIIHRVIGIGIDSEGWYARCKGDNNQDPDPDKVRFGQVTGIVVAVLY